MTMENTALNFEDEIKYMEELRAAASILFAGGNPSNKQVQEEQEPEYPMNGLCC
jgi:hypothetical protein